jgi:WD40 repeat protein
VQAQWAGAFNQGTGFILSPNGRTLGTGGGESVGRLWDFETRNLLALLETHAPHTTAGAFSPCGRRLASGGSDGTLKLWDLPDRAPYRALVVGDRECNVVAFSPDGQYLAAGNPNSLTLWLTHTWQRIHDRVSFPIPPAQATTKAPAFPLFGRTSRIVGTIPSPDGRRVVSISQGGEMKMWDASRNREVLSWTAAGGNEFKACSFSPDGRYLAVAGRSPGGKGVVHLWDFSPGP